MLGLDRKDAVIRVWAPHASSIVLEVAPLEKEVDKENIVSYECCRDENDEHDVWVSSKIKEIKTDFKYRFRLQSSWNDCYAGEGDDLYRRDPYAREVDFDSKWCYNRAKQFSWTEPKPVVSEPRKWIIYEMHLGSWVNHNTTQSIFTTVTEKLSHIAENGFTAIQLMPVTEFGGLWGYNPRMLMSVHSPWGTVSELKKLIDTAHALGLAIIVDIVINHGSSKRNELWAWDGYCPNNNGGIYFDKGKDTPWGKKFSFETRGVQRYLADSVLMWAEEYKVDGIRFDSAHNIPDWLCKNIIQQVRQKHPDVFLICEVTPENPYYIHDVGFDSCWIHSAHYDTRQLLHHFDGSNMESFKHLLGMFNWPSSVNGVRSVMGSHDQIGDRKNGHEDNGSHRYFVSRVGGRDNWHARAKCRMWYSLTIFSRGLPMIFQGTESNQDGFWHVDRPFNWQLTEDKVGKEMLALVSAANMLRVSNDAFVYDDLKICHEDGSNGVVALTRSHGDNIFFVVVHLGEGQWDNSDYCVHCGIDGNYILVFNSQAEEYGGWASSASENVDVRHGGGNMKIPKWWVGVYQRQ